jgi:hypothetical protein
MVADATGAVESTLDIRAGANEYTVADLHRLDVFEADPGTDGHTVPKGARGGAPYDSPHHAVELGIRHREARVDLEQPRQLVSGTEVVGQTDLELRVRRLRPQAVNGFD